MKPLALDTLARDFAELSLLLVYSFIVVYYVGGALADVLFLPLLILAYHSPKKYLWLVWFLIINDAPGRLFSASGVNDLRIPLYTIVSGISVSFQDLFFATFLLRFLTKPSKIILFYFKELQVFALGFIFYTILGFLIGMGSNSLVYTLQAALSWGWIFLVPIYLRNSEQVKRVSLLLFPFVFIALAFQIQSYLTGYHFDSILRNIQGRKLFIVDETIEGASRSYAAVYLIFLSLCQALFYYTSSSFKIPKTYLSLVIFTCTLTIFLTATRGWIIAFTILLVGTTFFIKNLFTPSSFARLTIVGVITVIILQIQFPLLTLQLGKSLERLSTLVLLAEGDINAGGTLERLDVRSVSVIDKFSESPILGFGFSNTFYRFNDAHVGHQNILLNVGVVGYLVITIIFFRILYLSWLIGQKRNIAYLVYSLALLSIFFIHTTSTQFWGYYVGFDFLEKTLTLGFIFAFINIGYKERRILWRSITRVPSPN